MEVSAKNKVKGGKLIYVKMNLESGILSRVRIFGDFFIYPESFINDIELSFEGVKADNLHAMVRKIRTISEEHGAEMIGITPESIVETIAMAVDSNGR
jgi:lipoate---protein ligase